MRSLLILAAFVAASVPVSGQWKAPRTPWGDPDLQGYWPSVEMLGVPFERPAPAAAQKSKRQRRIFRRVPIALAGVRQAAAADVVGRGPVQRQAPAADRRRRGTDRRHS
jgi:hypothetical protein